MAKTSRGPLATSAARTCTKQFYRDQPAARFALDAVLTNIKSGTKAPVRVHPCDVCDGWHLTSKKVSGKTRRGTSTRTGRGPQHTHPCRRPGLITARLPPLPRRPTPSPVDPASRDRLSRRQGHLGS
jgi:hypothetical protein